MRKKDVPVATQVMSKDSEKLKIISNDSAVINASKHLFGNGFLINDTGNNIGLNYGLLKVIVSGNCINSRGIARSNSSRLKTIGLTKTQKNNLTIENINTLSMTQHISTKMAA